MGDVLDVMLVQKYLAPSQDHTGSCHGQTLGVELGFRLDVGLCVIWFWSQCVIVCLICGMGLVPYAHD